MQHKVIVILVHFYWQRCVMLLKNVNDENLEIAFEFFIALFCIVLDNRKTCPRKNYTHTTFTFVYDLYEKTV